MLHSIEISCLWHAVNLNATTYFATQKIEELETDSAFSV